MEEDNMEEVNAYKISQRFDLLYDKAKANSCTYVLTNMPIYGFMLEIFDKDKQVILAVYLNDNFKGWNFEFVQEDMPNTFICEDEIYAETHGSALTMAEILDELMVANPNLKPETDPILRGE